MNKKGLNTGFLFVFIFIAFLGIMFFGMVLYGFYQVNSFLDQDLDIGQVNLAEVNSFTFGKITVSLLAKADWLGLSFIFGMVIFMLMNAYLFKNQMKVFIIVDILLLVGSFILAVYISNYYSEFLTMMANAGITIYENNLTKSSIFLLNLPTFIGTIGTLIMIISYTELRRPQVNTSEVYGYGY